MEAQRVSHGPNYARAKKWRTIFIILTITTVVLYIVGGALIGASFNCTTRSYDYFYDTYYTAGCINLSMYYAGCALLALASLSFLAWIVFLVLRFTSWYRQPIAPQPYPVAGSAPTTMPVTSEPKHVEPVVSPMEHTTTTTTTTAPPMGQKLCTTCEHPVAGAFCGSCGTKA